jgi:phage baseplate assembly protein gpV
MDGRSIFSLIRKIVYNETIYHLHWYGKVIDNQDVSQRGRVKVAISDLGFAPGMTQGSDGVWCSPRQGYSMMPPKVDEWVEVYFIGGDRKKPVYLVGVGEVKGNMPKQYSSPTAQVLWQNPTTGDYLSYDETAKEFTINVTSSLKIKSYGKLTIGGGSESFAKGDTLYTFLQSLMTWLGTHVHTGVTTGPGSSGTAVGAPSLSDIRSTTIKGE